MVRHDKELDDEGSWMSSKYKPGNAIGNEGIKMICEVLKANQAITELSLWGLWTIQYGTNEEITQENREQYWWWRGKSIGWNVENKHNH